MLNAQGRQLAIACAAAVGIVVPSWTTQARTVQELSAITGGQDPSRPVPAASRRPAGRWKTFSADVTIRRGLRDAAHKPIGEDVPGIRYRWQRTQTDGRWVTTMEVLSPTHALIVTPSNKREAMPPAIARVEDPGDGTGPRFFTQSGALVRSPTADDRAKLGGTAGASPIETMVLAGAGPGTPGGRLPDDGQAWIDAVNPGPGRTRERQLSIQRRFGRVVGKLRGLERYVRANGAETTEMLVDGDWHVPVEVNVVRDGTLQEHTTYGYEAGPGGSLLRRRTQTEHVIPEGRGARMALDVELANVKLSNLQPENGR